MKLKLRKYYEVQQMHESNGNEVGPLAITASGCKLSEWDSTYTKKSEATKRAESLSRLFSNTSFRVVKRFIVEIVVSNHRT